MPFTTRDKLKEILGRFPAPIKHKTLGNCVIIGFRCESDINNDTMIYVRTEDGKRYWIYTYESEFIED